MARVEVKITSTFEELDLIRRCVKEMCALLHCKPEARPIILDEFLSTLSVSDIEQLERCLSTGKQEQE